MAHLYFEYGGGLGDVLSRMAIGCGFNALHTMAPEDTAAVTLITHNPHAREIFDFHPRATQITVKSFDYWWPAQDRMMRARLGLPYPAPTVLPVTKDSVLRFFPAEHDKGLVLPLLERKFVVFSISGSDGKRDFPSHTTMRIIDMCTELGLLPVFVGRDYKVRHSRPWEHVEVKPNDDRITNLINRLAVPSVCHLVEKAVAVVACHSAIATLAWILKKRQLMLYPEEIERLISEDQPRLLIDKDPKCTHACFDDEGNAEMAILDFETVLYDLVKGGEQPA